MKRVCAIGSVFLFAALRCVAAEFADPDPERVFCCVCGRYVASAGGDHAPSGDSPARCPESEPGTALALDPLTGEWIATAVDDAKVQEAVAVANLPMTVSSTSTNTIVRTSRNGLWSVLPPWAWLFVAGILPVVFFASLFRRRETARPAFDVELAPGLLCSSALRGGKDGLGGMAEVHDARWNGNVRAVVKKLLPPGICQVPRAKRQEMLDFETGVLRRLKGLGIVPDVLFGPAEAVVGNETWQYYVMSEAIGRTWPNPRDGERFSSDSEARDALLSLCEALVQLHSAGIGHHDLKPQNVFWNAKGRSVTLLDFGSAIDHRSLASADSPLVNPMGDTAADTPPWIPPKSDGKRLVDLSTASDAWVYGLMFCEALVPGSIQSHNPEDPENLKWLASALAGPARFPEVVECVVDGLFEKRPSRRATMEKVYAVLRKNWGKAK